MQYLDNELATITVANTMDMIKKNLLSAFIKQMIFSNVKIVYFHIDEFEMNYINSICKILLDYENCFLCVKKEVALEMNRNEIETSNIIVIVDLKDLKYVVNEIECKYYQVQISNSDITFLFNHFTEFLDKIIIDIREDVCVDNIFNINSSFNKELMFRQFIISKSHLVKHPCNAYLCSEGKCHGNKGSFPRHIYINKDGDVFPYSLKDNRFKIGNINSNKLVELKQKYSNQDVIYEFKKINKKAYFLYVLQGASNYLVWENCLKSSLKGGLK